MTDLSNRIALVTGASRGIGAATAKRLAKDGARVIVHYSASADQAEAVVREIRDAGGQVDSIRADLANAQGPAQLAEAVKDLGIDHLDILVANAAVAPFATLAEQTIEDFDNQYAVNVRAPLFLVQALSPLLSEGASVIFTSSVASRIGFPAAITYASTKAAVDSLVKSLALEFGSRGIRVNAIAPGVIETDMASFLETDEGQKFALDMQAFKRIGQVDDVADVFAFLASTQARWITGRTIEVSGGAIL